MMRRWIVFSVALLAGIGVLAAGQVTISFWHAMGVAHGPALEKLVADFEAEYPDIKVELVYQGDYGALQQKLIAAVAAGNPPTIAQQYENWTTQFLDALVPLGDYLDPEVLGDVLPNLREGNTYPQVGKLVTVPFNKSIIVLYYRPDLVPEPPETWEEFLDIACKLTVDEDGDGVPERYGTALRPPNPEIFLTFLEQASGSILSPDWTEVTLNDERGIQAIKFAAELSKCALIQGAYISDVLPEGIVAMFLDTSAGYPHNQNGAKAGGYELRVALAPAGPENRHTMIQGTNLGVFSMGQTEEQILAAVKLVEFLLRPENTAYWAIQTGYIPVTQGGIESELWQTVIAENPDQAVMTEQWLLGFTQLLHSAYWDIRDVLLTMWEEVLRGVADPVEAINMAAEEIEYWITVE
jgi:multiple sugar transport system substrate-binding protein